MSYNMSYNMEAIRQMCSHTGDWRGPHLHSQGTLPGGGDVGAEPINPHKSKLLESRAVDCHLAAHSAALSQAAPVSYHC